MLKIQKWKDFNENGYLQGVRHAAHMATNLVCYGGHFKSKMAAKIQNPPIWGKFGFQVDFVLVNWYPS